MKNTHIIFSKASDVVLDASEKGREMLAALGEPRNVISSEIFNEDSPRGEATRTSAMTIASVVLKSFSVELGLKRIIEFENNRVPRVHNIGRLFSELSEQRRNNIRHGVCQHMNIDDTEFDRLMVDNGDIFDYMRYMHEKPMGVNHSLALIDALRIYVEKETENFPVE